MRSFVILATALAFMAGCANDQQGAPADFDSLPSSLPKDKVAPFDMTHELGVATAACVASEAQGPAALQSLRGEGYTAIKRMGHYLTYAKVAPRPGLLESKGISVSDTNDRSGCTIETPPNHAYTHFAQVAAALRAQGFVKVAQAGNAPRYAKGDLRLMLMGRTGLTPGMATIELRRMTSATDGLCRDASLPDTARQGC